jgi:hypothetical protein
MPFKQPFKPKWKSPLGDFATQVDVSPSALSNPPKSPIPEGNPFRVGLEPYRPPTPADVQAGNILKDVLDNGKKLGGIGIEIASDEAKEKITVAALGKVVATTVGVVAIPFAAADLFDVLAPGVKSWLTEGWKGGNGQGLPGSLSEPPFPYGQVSGAQYKVTYILYRNGQLWVNYGEFYFNGPLRGFAVPSAENGHYPYFRALAGDPPIYYDAAEGLNVYTFPVWSYSIYSVERTDGQTDPPASKKDTRAPHVVSPSPGTSPYFPSLPFPPLPPLPEFLKNLPSTESLKDLFEPLTEADAPSPSTGGESEGSPSSKSRQKVRPTPVPYSYLQPPKNPTPPLEEAGDCNPCQLAIGKKLDELREKLDEKKKDEEESDEATCETYPFEYSYGVCNNGEFKIEPRTLLLAQKPTPALRREFDDVLAATALACGKDAIAAIPDWWQVRIGADRPQIVVAFRKADSRTYHQIALPHPTNAAKWTENLLGSYQKGPWSGILTLKDNSKFIINCETKAEATRMVAKAKALIRPDMQFSPSAEQYTERKGNAVGVATMRGRQAYYFPTGQRDSKPEWRAQFN